MKRFAVASMVAVAASFASASLFEVTSVTTGLGGVAAGTSNGIGWTLSPTFIWADRTTTNNTYQGFGNAATHNPAMPNSDRLHIGGDPFTFTFDKVLSSAYIYLAENNNNTGGRFDFGIAPVYVSGNITISGNTFYTSNTVGGVVRLDNINSNQLFSSIDANDGHDFAVVAYAVPEPFTMALGALGLGVAALRRRRK